MSIDVTDRTNHVTDTVSADGSGNWSDALDLTALADGSITYQATATGPSGDAGREASVTATKDTTGPSVTTFSATESVTQANQTHASTEGQLVDASGVTAVYVAVTDGTHTLTFLVGSGNTWSCDLDLSSLNDGPITYEAFGVDIYGNQGAKASRTATKNTQGTDSTPPALTIALDSPNGGTPDGQNGWFVSGPVKGTVSADDTGTGDGNIASIDCGSLVLTKSGIGTATARGTFSIAGDGITRISCIATDAAGNTSDPMTRDVRLDTHRPTVSRDPSGDGCSLTGGANGWCRGVVSAGFSTTDAASGVASPCKAPGGASCPFSRTLATGEGSGLTISSGSVCDLAGNCSPEIVAGPFKRDTVPPVIQRDTNRDTCSLHGAAGWCRGTLIVAFSARDDHAGIGSACLGGDGRSSPCILEPAIPTGEGAAVDVVSRTVCDLAGNCTPGLHATVKIDLHAPHVQVGTSCSLPGNGGWCRGVLAAVFTTGDDESGIGTFCQAAPGAECSFSQVVTGEGVVNVTHQEICDVAGNCFHQSSFGPFRRDTQAPQIVRGNDSCNLPGQNGWCRLELYAGFLTSDSTSGLASPVACPAHTACNFSRLVTDEGVVSMPSGPVCDVAGNCNPGITRDGFKLDTHAPTLSPLVGPLPILLHGPATRTPGAADATSGLASQSCDPVDTSTAGVHTITCTARDVAGNVATASAGYLVEYKVFGFFSPAASSSWRQGGTITVKVALADAHGVRISDAEANGLLSPSCRVRFSAAGAQSANACTRYDTGTDEFGYDWSLGQQTGNVTISLTVSYPGTTTATVLSEPIVVTP